MRKTGSWMSTVLTMAVLGAGVVPLHAQDLDDGDDTVAEDPAAVIRQGWLDEQTDFALRLAERGWQDLAQRVLDQTEKGDPRIQQPAAGGDERTRLRRLRVRLGVQEAMRDPDLARRKTKGDEAIQQLTAIVAEMEKDVLAQYTAYNKRLRGATEGGKKIDPATRAELLRTGQRATAARDQSEEAMRDLASIYLDMARSFAREARRAENPENRPVARQAALAYYHAALFEDDGAAMRCVRALADRYANAYDRYAATSAKNRARAENRFSQVVFNRIRFSHKVEEAIATWSTLVNRSGAQADTASELTAMLSGPRAEVVKKITALDAQIKEAGGDKKKVDALNVQKRTLVAERDRLARNVLSFDRYRNRVREIGDEFFDSAGEAYEFVEGDAQVYWQWMKFLAAFDDPMFIAGADDLPNPLGKSKDRVDLCDKCHLHDDQRQKDTYRATIPTGELRARKTELLRGPGKRKIIDGESKETPAKEKNTETGKDEDVVRVVWVYELDCDVCHAHRLRFDTDALLDGKIPAERDMRDVPLALYNWNSDRVKYLFRRYFAWPQVQVAGDDGRVRRERNQLTPAIRTRGLFGYADALTSLAQGALERAADPKLPPNQKGDWKRHADELVKAADDALAQIAMTHPPVFGGQVESDPTLRALARLEVAVPWWITRARLAQDKKAGGERESFLKRAQRECALAQVDGGVAWRRPAQEGLAFVTRQAQELLGRPLPQTGDIVIARADELHRQWVATPQGSPERRRQAVAVRRAYADALSAMGSIPYGHERLGQMSVALTNITQAALARDDWATAYVALYQLLQEFNERQYPPARFASARKIVDPLMVYAARNLPGIASRLARQTGDPEIEIEGLRMAINANPEPSQDHIAQYGNLLKRAGRGDEALDIMNRVGPDNPYYGLMQLNAAQIHGDRYLADRETDPAKANEALAAMDAALANFHKTVDLAHRPPRPEDDQPAAQRVYDSVTRALPGATLLPLAILNRAGQLDDVVRRADETVKAIDAIPTLDPELRAELLSPTLNLRFLAYFNRVDAKQPSAEREKALRAADEALARLDAADIAGRYADKAYSNLGLAWQALADTYRQEGQAEKASEIGLHAARVGSKATRLVYQNMAAALRMAGNFTQAGNYAQAVEVFNKAIDYWNNGLFTEDYVLREDRKPSDAGVAQPPPVLSAPFEQVKNAAAWKGLASLGTEPTGRALADRLNEFVKAADWDKLRPVLTPFLTAALPLYANASDAADAALGQKLDAARALLERDDLAAQPAVGNRLMRAVLEAAYPALLVRAPTVSTLPAESAFTKALDGFVQQYPVSRDAMTKAALLLAMHDRKALRGRADQPNSDAATFAGRLRALQRIVNDPEKGDAEKKAASAEIALYDPGLRTYLYGVEQAGKRRMRSYPRARWQLREMEKFDKNGMDIAPGQDWPTMPTQALLDRIDQALRFESELLRARRQYAEALVNTAGRENETRALDVFGELVEYYPDDPDLLASLSGAEAQVGKNIALSDAGYNDDASRHFTRARFHGQQLQRRLAQQSEPWWRATEMLQQQALEEIRLRKQQNKPNEGPKEEFIVAQGGKLLRHRPFTPKLDVQVERLFAELNRLRQMNAPENENHDAERQERMNAMEAELRTLGFQPKEKQKVELQF